MRESGYYWVQFKPFFRLVWTVGFYNAQEDKWYIVGHSAGLDLHWEIGPLVPPPDEVAPPQYYAIENTNANEKEIQNEQTRF